MKINLFAFSKEPTNEDFLCSLSPDHTLTTFVRSTLIVSTKVCIVSEVLSKLQVSVSKVLLT